MLKPQYYLLLLIPLFLSGCGLLKKRGGWGKNALYRLKGDRILRALKKNITSAHVWVPAAGAGVS